MKPSTALFLGRFQPWHIGHSDALEMIFKSHDQVKIVIGSSQESRTDTNPWTASEREEIIQQNFLSSVSAKEDFTNSNPRIQTLNFLDKPITFYHLPDTPDNDELWLSELMRTVGEFDVLYTGNSWVRDICDTYDIPYRWIRYTIDISATHIREMLRQGEDVSIYASVHELPNDEENPLVRIT